MAMYNNFMNPLYSAYGGRMGAGSVLNDASGTLQMLMNIRRLLEQFRIGQPSKNINVKEEVQKPATADRGEYTQPNYGINPPMPNTKPATQSQYLQENKLFPNRPPIDWSSVERPALSQQKVNVERGENKQPKSITMQFKSITGPQSFIEQMRKKKKPLGFSDILFGNNKGW